MQVLEVSAVMAPSALGNSAEISATTKISCTQAGRWSITTTGNSRSPCAARPCWRAYRLSSPPRNRNSSTTPVMMAAITIMFFWASASRRTEMFFCIISWSRPVMATAIAAPASSCLAQWAALIGSVTKTSASPAARIACQPPARSRPSACSRKTTQITRPASMPVVCSVSVQTMVLTPPSSV